MNKIIDYYNKISNNSLSNLELEIRAKVSVELPDKLDVGDTIYINERKLKIKDKKEYQMHYFKEPINPSNTYRALDYKPIVLERKCKIATFPILPKNSSIANIMNNTDVVVLSTETKLTINEIMFPIAYVESTKIVKYIIEYNTNEKDINIELIVRDDVNISLEIEFTPKSSEKALDIYKYIQHLPGWPVSNNIKPKQVSLQSLARKLSSGVFYISPKADGIHALLFTTMTEPRKYTLITDNGTMPFKYPKNTSITEICTNKDMLVLECEYVQNNDKHLIYIFDIYLTAPMLPPKNIKDRTVSILERPRNTYTERLEFINKLLKNDTRLIIKPAVFIQNSYQLKNIDLKELSDKVPNNDGFIISNNYNRDEIFKLKDVSTVDLLYKDNKFYMNKEIINVPSIKIKEYELITKMPLINNMIYELEINEFKIIRERKDKDMSNAEMPEYCPANSAYLLQNSSGVSFLRLTNNKAKYKMLRTLQVSCLDKLEQKYGYSKINLKLIDIGSGKLGDIEKWLSIGFDSIDAVDPALNDNRLIESKKACYNITNKNNKYGLQVYRDNDNSIRTGINIRRLEYLNKINIFKMTAGNYYRKHSSITRYKYDINEQIKILNKNKYKNKEKINMKVASLFFVPWNDEFVAIIHECECTAIIIMDTPTNHNSNAYTVNIKVNNNEKYVKLEIPHSETAISIEEKVMTIKEIVDIVNKTDPLKRIINYTLIPTNLPNVIPEEEIKLVNMYHQYLLYYS